MTEFAIPSFDDVASGRAVWVAELGKYFCRTHNVSYSQQGVCSQKSYASLETATAAFKEELEKDRAAWSKGNGFTETIEHTDKAIVVRFRSKLKSGKPGRLTGIRMMVKVDC